MFLNRENSDKPRVLFLAPQPFLIPRGTPLRVRATVQALVELGYLVDLVTLPFGEDDTSLCGVRLFRVARLPGIDQIRTGPSWQKLLFDVLLFFAVLRRLCSTRYTSIHGVEEAGLIAAFTGRFFGIPYVFDMHSCMPEQLVNLRRPVPSLLAAVIRPLERSAIRHAAAVMTVGEEHSAYAARIASAVKAVGVQDTALENVGCPDGEAVERLRQEFNLADRKVVLYTGNFDPCQGVPLLLTAFARCIENIPGPGRPRLLIVGGTSGEAERRQEAEKLSASLHLTEEVIFTGCRPAGEMPSFMALADVLVSPRISGANTPLKVYSYMASGRVIVATDIRSHTQVLDASSCLLCRPEPESLGAALLSALDCSPEQLAARQPMITEAQRVLDERFSRRCFVKRIATLYSAVDEAAAALRQSAAQPWSLKLKMRMGVVIDEADETVHKPLWQAALKITLSVVALFAVYSSVNFTKVADTLLRMHLRAALLVILLFTLSQFISALKWRTILREAGVRRPFFGICRAYFFGMFVNTVGLGTVGGDVARAVVLRPTSGLRSAALASVVADRVHGLGVLFAIGLIALQAASRSLINTELDLLGIPLLMLLALVWWFGPRLVGSFYRADHPWTRAFRRIEAAFPKRPAALGAITALSVFFHLLQIYTHGLILSEFGAEPSFLILCAIVPFVNIASSLPISINGLGVREAMYALMFSRLGLDTEMAVALGAAWFAVVTIVSLLGFGFLVLVPAGRRDGSKSAPEPEPLLAGAE